MYLYSYIYLIYSIIIQLIFGGEIRSQPRYTEHSTRSGLVMRSDCSIGLHPNFSDQQEQHYRRFSNHSTSNLHSHPNTTDQRQSIPRQREPPSGLTPTSSQQLYNQEENTSKGCIILLIILFNKIYDFTKLDIFCIL